MLNKPIAFVTPWYGEGISGGAEAELRGLVKHLQAAGMSLEVLTTCVKSFRDDWNTNYHKEGMTTEAGIIVRRFRVRKRNTKAFDAVNSRLMQGRSISAEEEETYCKEMINSPRLYKYMRKHVDDYALFVFIPYMFGTTYYGCQICPEKSVLIPCLHAESYAYLRCFKKVYSQVGGMICHSEPERILAEELYGADGLPCDTLGEGLDTDWICDAQRFNDKYGIDSPFILYAGRKEKGKKVDTLVRYFVEYKKRYKDDLKLVLIGGGQIDIPERQDIIDLGFIDIQDKYDAYGAASIFCNPSKMESFSLVIMESWLAKTPVLVNGECDVTRDFVVRSNGGLYFESFEDFDGCVRYLLDNEQVSKAMGKNGDQFVRDNFAWDTIVAKYIDYFDSVGE